jgi:hypothetical protein
MMETMGQSARKTEGYASVVKEALLAAQGVEPTRDCMEGKHGSGGQTTA